MVHILWMVPQHFAKTCFLSKSIQWYKFKRGNDRDGGVAQMVERSLSMREVPGSIPGASNIFFNDTSFFLIKCFILDYIRFHKSIYLVYFML